MNAHSDDGYDDRMQIRQRKPVGQAGTYLPCVRGMPSVPLHFVQGRPYQSSIVLQRNQVIFLSPTFLYV